MDIKENDFVLVFNEDRQKKLIGKVTEIKVTPLTHPHRMIR